MSGPDDRSVVGPEIQTPGSESAVRDMLVAAVGTLSAVAVMVIHRDRPVAAVALAAMVVVSTWLAVIDLRVHRLPNVIVGPLAVAATVGVVVAGLVGDDMAHTGRAVGMGLALAGVMLVGNLLGGLGMGDVKYAYPVGSVVGWFGWDALLITIVVTTVTGGLVAAALLAAGRGRSHRLSYGPFMAIGLVAGLLLA